MSAGGKGVLGGAKKLVGAAATVFVLMALVPHIGTLLDLAAQLGGAVVQVVGALVGLVAQIGAAFEGVGGGQ